MTYYPLYILCIFIYFKIFKSNYNNTPFRSDMYATVTPLESNLDITEIISQINSLLPQLSNFIDQFHDFSIEKGINIITDSSGTMSIDAPSSISDSDLHYISKRIGIIDRLINTRGEELCELFKKGFEAEKQIKPQDPKYTSVLAEKLAEFNRLNSSYKH